ncbi:hypothetical protein vseg_010651 [Gypsophila vaccaria]
MCVNFTNINKACPNNCYPLPRIDRLVEYTSGHTTLSFLYAFSGYHQIFLKEQDRPKCAFITSAGVYMYKMIPFGLNNASTTYQRLMDEVFREERGRNVEVYVVDEIVKIKSDEEHLAHLRETFESFRKYKMMLNPKKCTFGVRSEKFFAFLVSLRGIDVNPDKVQAIIDLPEPSTIRDIQRLIGRMTALSRFIARSADKKTHFFKELKGNKKFKWARSKERHSAG